ncbi:MAG: MmcQ/YjbR family DNA-binding protein [Flavobacteriales bacterium]|nr:MmcQ/YjbR family DNA-binding protein [Flavobacteriales bacterium]
MDVERFRDYCISKKGVTESFPFDDKVLVFKVMGKVFALADIFEFNYINLKCDPEKAIELRANFEEIKPGYHMNKKLWNSVGVKGNLKPEQITELIDHSYRLIVESLSKKLQHELRIEEGK